MAFYTNLRKANVARHTEWISAGSGDVSLSYRGNELAGEVGEVCNIIKKLDRERMGRIGSRATREAFLEELADAYICLDLIQMDENITEEEMKQAIVRKFNKTSSINNHNTFLKP